MPPKSKSLHGSTLADLKARTRPGKGGCWLWTGNRNTSGYARLTHKNKNHFVHVLAYRLAKGVVPGGMSVIPTCGQALTEQMPPGAFSDMMTGGHQCRQICI